MTFAEYIRAARLALDLEQKEAAARLGITPPYLSDIERGNRAPPSAEILTAMIRLYKLDSDVTYYRAGMFPPDLAEAATRLPIDRAIRALAAFRAILMSAEAD